MRDCLLTDTLRKQIEAAAKRQTAAEYLKELENIGVLERRKIGKEVLYLNVKLYGLLLRWYVDNIDISQKRVHNLRICGHVLGACL